MSRLIGIPFLIVIGFLSALEPSWVGLGVFGICVAELVADMSALSDDVGMMRAST
jgi:hypothetical protein